jgi:hypothetical protein
MSGRADFTLNFDRTTRQNNALCHYAHVFAYSGVFAHGLNQRLIAKKSGRLVKFEHDLKNDKTFATLSKNKPPFFTS